MARFSFHKGSTEEEGTPEEATDGGTPDESGGHGSGVRRILIIAGIGVILIGGWYLAQPLFFSQQPPPPPSGPVKLPIPAPSAKVPVLPAPTKEPTQTPTPQVKPPVKEEAKATSPAPPGKSETPAPPAKDPSTKKAAVIPPAPGKPESGQPVAAEKPASPKPGEKASSKGAPVSYSLQVGAMVIEQNADALKRKLDAGGFPAVIRKGSAHVSKQIVTVGEPTAKREAEELSRRLNVDGFPSQLMAVGDKYTPQIGSFYSENEAIDLARELQKKNYSPKIIYKPATTAIYQVRHGKFDSRLAAVRRGEELKGKGFSYLVVRD